MTRARDVSGFISSVNAGGKNLLINGSFDHWQRTATGARTYMNGRAFLADRWCGAELYQQSGHQRVALGYVNSELNSQYALRVSSSSTAENSYGTRMRTTQKIESLNSYQLRGKKVTLSFWIRFSSATITSLANTGGSNFGNFYGNIAYYTSTTDGVINVTPEDSATSLTFTNGSFPTSWTKYTVTGTVPTNANNVSAYFGFASPGSTTASGDAWFELAQVQLETGTVATSFSRAGGSVGGDLALCQRYYVRYTCEPGAPYAVFAPSGYSATTTTAIAWTTLPTQLRAYPNSVDYGGNLIVDVGLSTYAVTGVSLQDRTNTKIVSANYTVASGLTAGQFATIRANNSATAYIGFDAEI